MRHSYFGRKLSRTANERKRLFRSLSRDVFIYGKITTTKAKAKAVQPMIEQLITKGKKGTDHAYRQILSTLDDAVIAHQIVADGKTRFAARTSGYTRIITIDKKRSDASEMVLLSLVDEVVPVEIIQPEGEIITTKTKTKGKEKPVKQGKEKKENVIQKKK